MHNASRHRRHWVVLVWITIIFFLFPLTPPISQHFPFEESVLGQAADTPAFMHAEPVPAKVSVYVQKPSLLQHEYDNKKYYLSLYVVFIFFLHSRAREILKRRMLAPLKFTSVYVVS
ncbi:hypothetical protein ACFQI7_19500 [Paenibacillus allorhizosphaerae]|uniref:Uncharacterized protein n=1 Tax=Paenibacillus allorhizosphaerae TaxID=2849866 RepID=A0ABM8VP56_9BACL|nr:hypothetical protein [Paenibacillus allorhizosphaerae]CAG7652189.1 hypothetical protein PAECIP111802_05159 [Paenibacillus allorhizosphaerae]